MSSSGGKETGPHQMKMVIGMVQNSYRIINQLITRVEELSIKLDDLNAALRRLEGASAGDSQEIAKNLALLSNLLLVDISSSLTKSLNQQPVIVNVTPPAAMPGATPGTNPHYSPQPGGQAQQAQPAAPPIAEEENIRPSNLFKKLQQ